MTYSISKYEKGEKHNKNYNLRKYYDYVHNDKA